LFHIVSSFSVEWFRVYNTPMPDEIKVDAAKFDRILSRMLESKPLSKAEISARIKAERNAKKQGKPKKRGGS
jgi:hypothetical protein